MQCSVGRLMGIIMLVGVSLGFLAANWDDRDAVLVILLPMIAIVVPLHFAIEGNRRDALRGAGDRTRQPLADHSELAPRNSPQ